MNDYLKKSPLQMSAEEIRELAATAKQMEYWLKEFKSRLHEVMSDGELIMGYDLVESRTNRIFSEGLDLAKLLKKAGVPRNLRTIEKFISPSKALDLVDEKGKQFLETYIVKPKGKMVVKEITL